MTMFGSDDARIRSLCDVGIRGMRLISISSHQGEMLTFKHTLPKKLNQPLQPDNGNARLLAGLHQTT